jgi:death-on-curing family protein
MYVTANQAKAIHEALVIFFEKDGDPISPSGVKDVNMLESALFRPQTSIADVEKYNTLDDKAAALLISLIQNHPFHNGNKRTALVSTLVFYDMNNYMLLLDEDETYEFLIDIANGDICGIDKTNDEFLNVVSKWLRSHKYPYLEKFNDIKTKDFIHQCKIRGAYCKKSKNGGSHVISINGKSIRISQSTKRISSAAIKSYFSELQLSQQYSGLRFDELVNVTFASSATFQKILPLMRKLALV